MSQEPPLNFAVGKPPFDPDRVVCDECGSVGPIERMAEINLTDRTPERALGGGTVAVRHYCQTCFVKMIGLGATSDCPPPKR